MSPVEPDSRSKPPVQTGRTTRIGLWLFALYTVIYAGFVGLSAFSSSTMASRPFGGVNLALIYGFGLIVLALVLALIYLAACGRDAQER